MKKGQKKSDWKRLGWRRFSAPGSGKRRPCALYQKWLKMKSRCFNKNDGSYKYYGGKGITICEDWLDYEKFRMWAIESGFRVGLTIDRIDSNKDYSPENCQWLTHGENSAKANRETKFGANSANSKLTDQRVRQIRESKLTTRELAKTHGVHYSVISLVKNHKAWKHVT